MLGLRLIDQMRRQGGLALALGALAIVSACTDAPKLAKKPKSGESTPEGNCANPKVVDLIRDRIFDAAIAEAKEGTQNLNNLRSAIIGRIENPVLQGHDDVINRTQCSGRLVFPLPPTTHKVFDNATNLAAEISYSVQPAADNSGLVVQPNGIEGFVQSLVAATQVKRKLVIPQPPPRPSQFGDAAPKIAFDDVLEPPPVPSDSGPLPPLPAQNPSFSCKGKLSRVERMVCNDPVLADQDRAMASAYRDARGRTPEAERPKLEAERQKYFARRNSCADTLCVATVYDEWTAAMYSWSPKSEP